MAIFNEDTILFTFGPRTSGMGWICRKGEDKSWCNFPVKCRIKERDSFTEMIADILAKANGLSKAHLAYSNYKDGVFKYIFRDCW